MHAFDHSAEADSKGIRGITAGLQRGRRNSLPLIAHLEVNHAIVLKPHGNLGGGTFRVPKDVGETFLENSKDCQFRVAGKSSDVLVEIAGDLNPTPLGEAFDIPGYGGAQADLL